MSPIVERIQLLFINSNQTPAHVFEKLGMPKNALSIWKTGKAKPSSDAIIKLAYHFNVSTDYLLTGVEKYDNLSSDEVDWLNLYKQPSPSDNRNNSTETGVMSIADRIREEGNKYNMTIASIEKKLNISNGTIRNWNKRTPSSDSLYKVSKLLHCSMEYLLTGKKEETQLSQAVIDWLNLYKQLSSSDESIRNECIGFVKGYIARDNLCRNENKC